MRYIYYHFSNGYEDCDEEGSLAFDDEATDEYINSFILNRLTNYGLLYEFLAKGYELNYGWEDEDAEQKYYDNLSYSWQEISPEEFDKYQI